MPILIDSPHSRHERIAIPTIWVALALSLLLHAAVLWGWLAKIPMLPFEDFKLGKPGGALAVRLAPPPSEPPGAAQPPAPALQAQPAPARRPAARNAVQRAPAVPRVLALERPSPSTSTATATAPPAESEQERHNRTVAASLGLLRTPGFGTERDRGGGIFQIQRMGYDDAEFAFFGWNKTIERNLLQTIEVRRGDNPTLEIAVVRRMIAIIREHVSGDFLWESRRLHRDVSLSARPADNAGLEDFMMREFFADRQIR